MGSFLFDTAASILLFFGSQCLRLLINNAMIEIQRGKGVLVKKESEHFLKLDRVHSKESLNSLSLDYSPTMFLLERFLLTDEELRATRTAAWTA